MKGSELFESDEEVLLEKESEKFFQRKSYRIGFVIVGSALFVGLFLMPLLLDNQIPIISELFEGDAIGGTHDFQKTTDQVKLSVRTGEIFYFDVVTIGTWSGDYIDGNKIPQAIEPQQNNVKFQFRCYVDEYLGTSTYFATFRGLEGNAINVKVLYGDQLIEEKNGAPNQAVILEGSC